MPKPSMITPSEDQLSHYPEPLQALIQDFVLHRHELGKPMTSIALKRFLLLIDRLIASKRTIEEIIEAIDTSIARNWLNVFLPPLTKEEQKTRYLTSPSTYKHLYTSTEIEELLA